MHQSVRDIWVEFNEPLEGVVHCLYADVLGLVTTGMGNLVDPLQLAIGLSWKTPDGKPATRAEIATAWMAVKNDPLCAKKGWAYAAKLPANNIRLSQADVEELISRKLEQLDAQMAYRFDEWESWPADAQLGVLSMAWAMGPGFVAKFPKFTAACRRKDFGLAAVECEIKPAKGTVVLRNARDKQLFYNAAEVISDGADPSVLVWPGLDTAA